MRTLDDALRDGWGLDSAEDEQRRREAEAGIAVEVPPERTRELYRNLRPTASGIHVSRASAVAPASPMNEAA